VVSVSKNERTFHSFYALIASRKYNMRNASDYELLKQSNCYESTHINDGRYFEEINSAFASIGFDPKEIDRIWILVGSILMLGNINFDETNHLIDESKPCIITHQ
jgi:myosin heavy subunit